jgi:GTPase
VPFPMVALVGYTNAGKSTLFNRVTGAAVLAKDMLFATLDPTLRGVVIGSGQKIILSDTVGFISDLPTQLVAAFRATLEEVLEADLILHIRDISHPETAEQAADVLDILTKLGVAASTPVIEVWNKIDLLEPSARHSLLAQKDNRSGVIALSAQTGEGVDALEQAVAAVFDDAKSEAILTLPFAHGRARARLHALGVVVNEEQDDTGYRVSVLWSARQQAQWKAETGHH